MVAVSSWGRLGQWEHRVTPLSDRSRIAADLATHGSGLAYGMGRSYGDVCLNPGGTLWTTRNLDRFIRFDEESGVLECEAGVLLRDIQQLAIPRGWMLPVTPGTWFVTVGGAIANDVHGKNHHRLGSFGDHVLQLRLVRTDGSQLDCGPADAADWFAATIGGLGLTGVIATATLQLRPVCGPWLETETIPYAGLDEFFELADGSEEVWEYTVSWIDCLSGSGLRGIFLRGNHADDESTSRPAGKPSRLGFTPPLSLVNRLTLRPANGSYYHLHRLAAGRKREDYRRFFYPLDRLADWNRMYGPRGFYQYQCVLPTEHRRDALSALLDETAQSKTGSFLAVLKTFGERRSPGMLSFPRPGATLALDFPNRGGETLALMARLDAIVGEAGGRLYPAKDGRMPQQLFESGYPRLREFLPFRDAGISSALSRRLLGR